MKGKRSAPSLGPWDVAALVMAGLLYLGELTVGILLLGGVGWMVSALEAGVFTAVLLLLGMILYFLGKGRGMGTCWRRVLLGTIVAGGVLIAVSLVAVVVLIAFSANL